MLDEKNKIGIFNIDENLHKPFGAFCYIYKRKNKFRKLKSLIQLREKKNEKKVKK
jgi:hypothetical protein